MFRRQSFADFLKKDVDIRIWQRGRGLALGALAALAVLGAFDLLDERSQRCTLGAVFFVDRLKQAGDIRGGGGVLRYPLSLLLNLLDERVQFGAIMQVVFVDRLHQFEDIRGVQWLRVRRRGALRCFCGRKRLLGPPDASRRVGAFVRVFADLIQQAEDIRGRQRQRRRCRRARGGGA
ncbi:hypothetical protein A6R72_00235 [Xanthomonas translucens pv. graminis]|nr:hypothetical protein A6R72_00235 [Xanthomonas translucens pv. graminis]